MVIYLAVTTLVTSCSPNGKKQPVALPTLFITNLYTSEVLKLSLTTIFGVALAALSCNSSHGKTPDPPPCTGPNPDPQCSVECTNDSDCTGRFNCGPEKTCTADCTAHGGQCSGQVCDLDGSCVDEPDLSGGCARADIQLTPVKPTVIMLVDRSGSMTANFGGVDRWNAVKNALTDPVNGVAAQLESAVSFGATLYNSEGGNAGGTCPILRSEPPKRNNASAIRALFDANLPDQDTPTAESIDAVAASFPPSDDPRIIVLATDGDPDNCIDSDAHDQSSQILSENAVVRAFTSGIETAVLSVGDQTSVNHLQRLANAGRGQDLANGNAPFYVANNSQELIDAFTQIIAGVRGCQVKMDGSIDANLEADGTVILNGTILEFNVDWRVIDSKTIELIGAACDELLASDQVNVKAQFPCPVVID